MTAIAQGVTFTVILQGQSTLLKCDKEVLAEMSPYLNNYNLSVLSTSIDTEDFGAFSCLYPGNFHATLMLQSGQDTDDSTVSGEVTQAFSIVTKSSPISVSIPIVAGQPTGQPGAPADAISGVGDSISNFFSGLQSGAKTLLIGLAAVIIIVLLIVAFGPNVKHVAGTLA